MNKILATSLGMLLATLAIAPVANSTAITTGAIQVTTPGNGSGNFSFLIGGSNVTGFFDEGTRFLVPGLEGTSFAGNHSNVVTTDMFYGFVDSAFVLWNKPGGASPVHTAINSTSPGALLMSGQTVYHTDFEFAGALCGSFIVNTPCDVIFSELTGHGIAEFTFTESVAEGGLHLFTPTKAIYTFVPEPGMTALFCVGLVAIAFAKRRQLFQCV